MRESNIEMINQQSYGAKSTLLGFKNAETFGRDSMVDETKATAAQTGTLTRSPFQGTTQQNHFNESSVSNAQQQEQTKVNLLLALTESINKMSERMGSFENSVTSKIESLELQYAKLEAKVQILDHTGKRSKVVESFKSPEVVQEQVLDIDFEIDTDLELSEKATLIATAIFQKFDSNKNATLDKDEVRNFFMALLKMAGIDCYEFAAEAMT